MLTNFKLFENNVDYEVLGTNHSSTSWEYDHHEATATILLDKSDDSLYLKIRAVHTKSGLGAGSFPKDLVFIKIGNLQKADLALVKTLLKKHSYDQRKFSIHWEDEEGNKMSLTELIKMHKPEKVKKEMKHIKSIDTFDEPIKKDIEIVKYSDRSYAIFGKDTKEIKDQLMNFGCRYNKFLTDPRTTEKRPGWICSINKIDRVREII